MKLYSWSSQSRGKGQAWEFPGNGQQKLATNESLTLESRALSGWCQSLGLWPVWATWLRLAPAWGWPRPLLAICFIPQPLVTESRSHLGQSSPDVLWEKACFSLGMTPNLCPHTSIFLESYPFRCAKSPCPSRSGPSLSCLLSSLPIWAHLGPHNL